MAYRANPFLDRSSEKNTSDHEFVRLFSPQILERLDEGVLEGSVHIFKSSPGGGKTTLLRAFTPNALRNFWRARTTVELRDSFPLLAAKGVIDERDGPLLLGVYLSCAAGYADLPPGAALEEGLFRALLDCRIVLRTLRTLASYLGLGADAPLNDIKLDYTNAFHDITGIPRLANAADLAEWAEQHEKKVYAQLDAFGGSNLQSLPGHSRFEGVLWLQSIRFMVEGVEVATRRLLMIDDVQRLRTKQRKLLIDELTVLRPAIPIWLAVRTIAFNEGFLSQGAREGRDLREYPLDEIWGGKANQFQAFARGVLDRRMNLQNLVPGANFTQCIREELEPDELRRYVKEGVVSFKKAIEPHQQNVRYSEWLARAEQRSSEPTLEMLIELYSTTILIARDASKRQMSLELSLGVESIDDRDSSALRNAAEIFLHEEVNLPYYYGWERLCSLATNNIEELLFLAAGLYEGVQARQVLGKRGPELSPIEQEKQLVEAAKRKVEFIPRSNSEGARASQLLRSIAGYCRERTFIPNAPYAPGVTGVRLSQTELQRFHGDGSQMGPTGAILLRVLTECVAENLLITKPSQATTGREGGTVFYLNRTLCCFYGLPLQYGGWQDLTAAELVDWMIRGRTNRKNLAGES